jgi:PST family polysaccharide transporter
MINSVLKRGRATNEEHFATEQVRQDLSRRTVRGGAVMLTAQGIKFVIGTASTIVLARLLSPHAYGLIGMVAVVTGFIALFKNLGLSTVMIQQEQITHEQASTLFWLNVGVSIVLMLVTLALSPLVARFYAQPQLTLITAAFALGFFISGLSSNHEAILKRQMRFVSLVAVELTSLVIAIVVAIVLASRGAGVWALVANQLTLVTAYTIGLWIVCAWLPGLPGKYSNVRSLLAFGRNLTGYNVLNYFGRNLDNLLVGKFWGTQQLGLYAKAYQLLLLPLDQLGTPLDGVAVGALSRLTDSPERYRAAYLRILDKVAMFSMPAVAFMIVTADWLVEIVLGPNWTGAARIFAALGLMGLFEPVANTMGWLMISQGRGRHVFQWGVVNSIITVVSFVIGLRWGAFGVALCFSLIGVLVRIPLLFWFATRVGPVKASDIYKRIALPLLAAVTVLATIYVFRNQVILSPVFGVITAAALAFSVTIVVFLITTEGRERLRDLLTMLAQVVNKRSQGQVV